MTPLAVDFALTLGYASWLASLARLDEILRTAKTSWLMDLSLDFEMPVEVTNR